MPYCPRCGTALSSHELALGYKDVVDPSVYVRFAVAEDGGPLQAGDELLVWTTTPWTLVVQRGGRGRSRADLRARQDRRAGGAGRARRGAGRAGARRERPDPRALPGRGAGRRPLRAAVPLHQGRGVRRARPHRPARRLRHRRRRHRPRPHRDRLRRGRLPARRAVRPERRQPGAPGRDLRRAHRAATRAASSRTPTPTWSRTSRAPRPAAARRGLRALLPALLALRHAAALLRQAVVVHRHVEAARPAARRQRDGHLAPRRTSSTGASATGWRTTSTGRCRASATGARRCRCGAASDGPRARASARSPSSRSSRASRLDDPHRPYVDDVDVPVPAVRRRRCGACPRSSTCGSTRARCRSRSGTRRSRTRSASRALPGRLHLRGAGPDARLVLLAARRLDAAVRPSRPTRTSSASG